MSVIAGLIVRMPEANVTEYEHVVVKLITIESPSGSEDEGKVYYWICPEEIA